MKLYRVIRHFCWMVEMLLFSTGLLLMSGVEHPVSSRIRMVHYDCVPQCRTILTIRRLPQSGFAVDNSGEAIGGLSFLRCLSFDDSWSSRPFPFCEVPQIMAKVLGCGRARPFQNLPHCSAVGPGSEHPVCPHPQW